MTVTTIAIVVAVFVLGYVGLMTVTSGAEMRQARRAMEEFAAKYGVPFEPGENPSELKIEGTIEGQSITVATRELEPNPDAGASAKPEIRTTFRASVDVGPLADLTARPDRIGKTDRGLAVGHPPLDEPYVLDGRPQHAALQFLSRREVSDALVALHENVEGARIVHGDVRWEMPTFPASVRDIESTVDGMVACAEAISKAAADFDPDDWESTDPGELDDVADDKAEMMGAWRKAADQLGLRFVATGALGDIALGGTVDGRAVSICTRGPDAESSADLHALLEVDLPTEHLDDVVIAPKDQDWRLFGMHDQPDPVGAEEFEFGEAEIDDNYHVVGESFDDHEYLRSDQTVAALRGILSDDRVLEFDMGTLLIEFETAPAETDTMVDLLEQSADLANTLRDLDAA